ncbi:MAG: DPP IV N-terminal domain-containing protein [Acidobacteria bacterium]|nr:DPP IV N-terminal domain-containing protein [Acidobacteriota bacterium]
MNYTIAHLAIFFILTSSLVAQSPTPGKKLTIEAIVAEGGITGRAPEDFKWSPDNSKFSFVQRDDSGEHGQLWYVDVSTGEKKELVSELKLATLAPPLEKLPNEREKERVSRYHVATYQWAPDSKHLLFDSQGQLWSYTIDNGTAIPITSSPEPSLDAKFSPDGTKLAYIRKHNLFVRPSRGGGEKQLTNSASQNDKQEDLLNGEVDWVYAEELDVRSNYFWSPNGKYILYLQMDESRVPSYPLVNWGPVHPLLDMEKYPKAGDPNPLVRLGVVASDGGKTKWLGLTEDRDTYIPRFGWVRDDLIWAQVLNRLQDTLDLYFVDAHSGKSRKVLTESSANGWVYVNNDFRVLKSGDRFTWQSWRDGSTQLYLYSFAKNDPLGSEAKLERQLTKGDFEVVGAEQRGQSGINAIDENQGVVYFTCDKDDPRERQLYSVQLDGSAMQPITEEKGTHLAWFAGDAKHYVDEYSAILTPPRLSLCSVGGPCKKVWDARQVDNFGLLPPKFLEFRGDDGTKLYGQLIMPSEAPKHKIPLIVYVYGGPAAQTVRNRWLGPELFHQILAQNGYAIFTVDNRGTPGRDRTFQTSVRHQYGRIELKDQLAALHQLFAEYEQLDQNRVAIWGWSNGGSMSLYAMTHANIFKAGVSVAPVTDWRNYDSIYTERNNGLPSDKTSTSYMDMDLPKQADQLHGSLLLVHGSSDDNVHFQNTVQMTEALIKNGKQFSLMVYPGKTHGISGSDDRAHLFHMIEDHFDRWLKP